MQTQTFIPDFCENLSPPMFQTVTTLLLSDSTVFGKLGVFASLHRKFGDEKPTAHTELINSWKQEFGYAYPSHWSFTDWARLCFFWLGDSKSQSQNPKVEARGESLTASPSTADLQRGLGFRAVSKGSELLSEPTITRLIRRGDHSEQISLARILFYLPEAHRFQKQAELWLATNSSEVFSSLALKNPFPAEYFDDLYFRQMVVKSLFIDLPTRPIFGLKRRFDSELFRMSQDYKKEREIAGRSVPIGMSYLEELSK